MAEFGLMDPADLPDIKRRQALAQALMQQAQEPLGAGQSTGRYVTKVSPFEGLAKLGQAYFGKQIGDKAGAQEKAALVAALRQQQEAKDAEAEGLLKPEQVQGFGIAPEPGALYYGNQKRVTKVDRPAQSLEDKLALITARANAPQRPKLKPGERFKTDGSDEVEAIPGSDLFKKQSDAHAKDAGALDTVTTQTDNAARKIDIILDPKNKDAFDSMFGGYNAAAVTQFQPGATQDIKKEIESLKSDLKKAGLDMLRSGGSVGQMTVQEWPIVESAIESISPMLGEEVARDKLAYVKAYLQRIRDNAAKVYEREWSGSQFAPGAPPPPPGAAPAAPAGGVVKWGRDAQGRPVRLP